MVFFSAVLLSLYLSTETVYACPVDGYVPGYDLQGNPVSHFSSESSSAGGTNEASTTGGTNEASSRSEPAPLERESGSTSTASQASSRSELSPLERAAKGLPKSGGSLQNSTSANFPQTEAQKSAYMENRPLEKSPSDNVGNLSDILYKYRNEK